MKSHKIHRSFEAEHPNQIWQSDILYGPYLPDPKAPERTRRTYLAAFIDDFLRLAPHGEFYWDEKFPALENTLKKALLKRGLPQIIYVDNGKIFSARRLDAVCAALGIRPALRRDPPYSPEGKGKIERFFRTVREACPAAGQGFSRPALAGKCKRCKRCMNSTSSFGDGWRWLIISVFTAPPTPRH